MRANGKMRKLLPADANVPAVIVDHSGTLYIALKGICYGAAVISRHFHVLKNIRQGALGIIDILKYDKWWATLWRHSLVFGSMKVDFNRPIAAVVPSKQEAMAQLSRTWIPYRGLWDKHRVKWLQSPGSFKANRVEVENEWFRHGWPVKSPLADASQSKIGIGDELISASSWFSPSWMPLG